VRQRNPGKGKKHKPIPEALIQARAYEIWKNRQREGKDDSTESDWQAAIDYLEKGRWDVFLWKLRWRLIQWGKVFWNWTGFREKKGWDFLQLLITPLVLVFLAQIFTYCSNQTNQKIANNRYQRDTLEKYFDEITKLLFEKNLRQIDKNKKNQGDEAKIARTKTLSALRELDPDRKGLLLKFLYEDGLVSSFPEKTIIFLADADLSSAILRGSHLSRANLSRANLSKADLKEAYLAKAYLVGANLAEADLRSAILGEADIRGADLTRADLTQADLTQADLRNAKLTAKQVKSAKNWEKGFYNKDFCQQLELSLCPQPGQSSSF
jgi:uncharacterized protein YjbI with pentapeptide repeats